MSIRLPDFQLYLKIHVQGELICSREEVTQPTSEILIGAVADSRAVSIRVKDNHQTHTSNMVAFVKMSGVRPLVH